MKSQDTETPILFITDLDGTLIESRQAIADAINATLLHFQCQPMEDQKLFRLVGIPISKVFAQYFSEQQLMEAVSFYRSQLVKDGARKTRVMPGALEVLSSFRRHRIKIFVASNKISSLTQIVLEQQGLSGFIHGVVGSDLAPPKPHPGMILHAMQAVPAKRTIMFGDRPEDIQAGQSAGAETIFLCGEFNELLAQNQIRPNRQVSSWDDVKTLLVPPPAGIR